MGRTGRSGGSIARTVHSGSSSTRSAAQSGGASMANVTDDLGDLTVSGRTSRATSRQTSTPRDPTPDYASSSDEAVTGGTVKQARSDVPRPKKSKPPRLRENDPEHNKKHFPDAYKKALAESKPGTVLRPHETIKDAQWITGDAVVRTQDKYFNLPVRNEAVRFSVSNKGPRDRFGFNV